MDLTAADVMTREVITVTPSTPVAEFARLCAEDRISGVPVVTADGRLVGVVSRTDLLPALLESGAADRPGRDAAGEGPGGDEDDGFDGVPDPEREGPAAGLGNVDEIMQVDPITVPPGMALAEVARRMAKERIHRVVVVERGRVVGIITSLDLLGHFPAAARTAPRAPRAPARRRPSPRRRASRA